MLVAYICLIVVIILISMMLHELAHGYVAYLLGDDTAKMLGRLSFNPIHHIDPFMTILLPVSIAIINMTTGAAMPIFGGAKPVPFNPNNVKYGEVGIAILSIAGPLTNFLLAMVFFALFKLFNMSEADFLGSVVSLIISVNLGFFAFNLLPIPPLDGSRVLYAIAPDFMRRILEYIEAYGAMFIFLIVMVASPVITTYISFMIEISYNLFNILFAWL